MSSNPDSMPPMVVDILYKISLDPVAYGMDQCLLCHEEPVSAFGFWLPSEAAQIRMGMYDHPEAVVYALCDACAPASTADDKRVGVLVEAEILKDFPVN